jgi:ADP-heptose:LPS heptosyltransferase
VPDAELHFVTKEAFNSVLAHNPFIDKLHTFKKDISEIYQELQAEKFDLVIDLHKNLRSLRLKQKLAAKSYSFDKLNLQKFLAVNLKMRSALPSEHIVDRYLAAVKELGVINDHKGLDYFLSKEEHVSLEELGLPSTNFKFIALVIGGSYFTKKIPVNELAEICQKAVLSIIVIGGKEDKAMGEELKKKFPHIINMCGRYSLNQSASVVQQAEWVITGDTGLMHIAAAFHKKIISVWGNTIPEFGMGPYLPNEKNKILEVPNLKCRPCSKLGFKKCPKTHFKCMNEIDFKFVSELQ